MPLWMCVKGSSMLRTVALFHIPCPDFSLSGLVDRSTDSLRYHDQD